MSSSDPTNAMTSGESHPVLALQAHLDQRLAGNRHVAKRVYRQLLVLLHSRGVVTLDQIYEEARQRTGMAPLARNDDPNQLTGERLDEGQRELIDQLTREYAARHLTLQEVDDVVDLSVKREGAQDLGDIASLETVSFRILAEHVRRFCDLPLGETALEPSEVFGVRVDLIRRLISDQLEFIKVAKKHLHIQDFYALMSRIIGNESGIGRIGGKAGGMFLAHKILESENQGKETPCLIPDSYYLRSDVVNDFMELNGLQGYRNQKYKDVEDIRREYPLIKGVFRNADFPVEIVQSLRAMLDETGPHPLIVRSSSLLEDRFGTAFYGKYASIFLANQGDLEFRLRSLLAAIGEVFASIYAPDPLLYRKEHHLEDYDEDMAVLIQKVVGKRVGRYFLPVFAGVAFSRNEFPFSPRIQRTDGLLRMVTGLGTRAVDRVGSDYPRMIPLGQPSLRPESSAQDVRRVSQKSIDVLDLQTNSLRTVTLKELFEQSEPIPMLDKIVSVWRDGELYPLTTNLIQDPPERLVVTFDKLVAQSDLMQKISGIVHSLERAYGHPVEVEFAHDGDQLHLLQCRVMSLGHKRGAPPGTENLPIPRDVAPDRVIFSTHRHVRSGYVEGLEYVVYVNPQRYNDVATASRRLEIGRVVGKLNRALAGKAFALIGPGRWGSNDLLQGVKVTYVDINHCQLLIEVARKSGDFTPEVSFGTHFFQDLVEAGIQYLPLYPDEADNQFNAAFFDESPSSLANLLPAEAEYSTEIQVIHVPKATQGKMLRVIMNSDEGRAVGFLT